MFLLIFTISGKRPVSMLMDEEWDLKSHPYLDPKGENNLNAEREVNLSNVKYIEQRIKNVNPAYAKTISILFAFLNYICCYEGAYVARKSNLSIRPTPSRNLSLVTGWGWCCGVGSWCLQAVCLQTPYYQAVFMQCSCSVHAVFRQCSGSVQTPSQPWPDTQNKRHHAVVVR